MTNWFDDDPAGAGADASPDDPWGSQAGNDPAVPPNPFLDPNDPLAGYPQSGVQQPTYPQNADPYGANPYGSAPPAAPNADPFAVPPADPFASAPAYDPYGNAPTYDPYAPADPISASSYGYDTGTTGVMPYADPYADPHAPQGFDPYADPYAAPGFDPYNAPGDPYGVAMPPQSMPFNDPYASIPAGPTRAPAKSSKLAVFAIIFGVILVVGGFALFMNRPDSEPSATPSTSVPVDPSSTLPPATTAPSAVDRSDAQQVAEDFTIQYLSFTGARGTQAWVAQFSPYSTPALVDRISAVYGDWLSGDLGAQAAVATVTSVTEVTGEPELTFTVEAETVRTQGAERFEDQRTLRIVVVSDGDDFLVDDVV